MAVVNRQWFLDAWAVLDGLAFASKRSAEQIDAEQTVFFSVPDLEPVPLGRMSTSLLATRFNFQQGFRDEEGQEIGFQSLEQVREVVRRGYLAGGIGPDAGGLIPPESPVDVPPPDIPPNDVKYFYESTLDSQKTLSPPNMYRLDWLADKGKRSTLIDTLGTSDALRAIYPYLRAFVEATLSHWFHYHSVYLTSPDRKNALSEWLRALVWIRLWNNPVWALARYYDKLHLNSVVDIVGGYLPIPATLTSSSIFAVPCPLRPGWDGRIRMLTDKVFLALSTKDYFQINSQLPEFIPALSAAMLITLPQSFSSLRHLPATNEEELWETRALLVRKALGWLDNNLPQLALPDSAERVLTKFAWNRLSPQIS